VTDITRQPLKGAVFPGRENKRLSAQDAFEPRLVLEDKRRTFYLQELFFLEIGEQPSHGLSGGPDHLGDFLVGEGKGEPDLAFFFSMVCREIESGQLSAAE
jgi:hypothetical protein